MANQKPGVNQQVSDILLFCYFVKYFYFVYINIDRERERKREGRRVVDQQYFMYISKYLLRNFNILSSTSYFFLCNFVISTSPSKTYIKSISNL